MSHENVISTHQCRNYVESILILSHLNTFFYSPDKPSQASFTAAGLAGGVALVTGLGPPVFVEAWRTAPQALPPLLQVDKVRPTA